MHLIDQLMMNVVRITAIRGDGNTSVGSGFAYELAKQEDGRFVPAIVTNKHVVEGAQSVTLPIGVADKDGNSIGTYEKITYALTDKDVIMHPDPEVDLCAIVATPIYQYFGKKQLEPYLFRLDKDTAATDATFEDLLPLTEVTMIGYPNGIWDYINNGALARRGYIATNPENDYLGKKEFVVDMACFNGSSGSPVYLANFGAHATRNGNVHFGPNVKLLGVLYAGPQHTVNGEIVLEPIATQSKAISRTSIPNNLGFVIKASELAAFEPIAESLLDQASGTP